MRKLAATFFAAFVALLLTAQQTPEQFNFYVNTLPAATTAFSGDQLYVRQAGLSKQMTIGVLTTGLTSFSGALTVGDCASWSTTTGRLQDSGGPCQATPGGLSGQVQVNLNNAFAGINNTSLTALINPCTSALSGAVPGTGGGNTNLFLNGNCQFSTPAGAGNVSTSGVIVTGNCAQWNSTTTLISTTAPCGSGGGGGGGGTNLGWINVQTFGTTGVAMGDGNCHQLSASYASLAAAQAVYPFVSDLTQCIDWAAIQQAINVSYTSAPLVNGSFPVYCPIGNYQLSNPLVLDTPTNGLAGSAAAWVSGTTYASGTAVKYNGLPFVSAGAGNVGNPPTLYSTFPATINLIGGGGTASGYPYAAVRISNASPAVVTVNLATGAGSSALQVVANQPIIFFPQEFANPNGGATPVLPTGVNINQVYYVIGSSINTGAGTFQISATPGGAAINTSSAGVGHFFASGQVWQLAPIQTGDNFSIHISLIGAEGLPFSTNSGCVFQSNNNWTAPIGLVGPGNGNLVKNVQVLGNVSGFGATNTSPNGYRCSTFASLGGPMQVSNAWVAPIGWAVMSDGGGASKTRFENVGSFSTYINDYRSYGSAGALVDQNLWDKVNYSGGCIGLYMGSTQAFINTLIDSSFVFHTNSVVGYTQEGVKALGGIYTTPDGAAQQFSITSPTFVGACGNGFFGCITATITSPDNNFQNPMCSYSAGQANNASVKWLNAWHLASGCGYNTFIFPTTRWGYVGTYIMDYDPFTGNAVFGIPNSFGGIYQGTCCGANFTTQIAATTFIYAVESAIHFFGDNQIENVHIEDDGVPSTMVCFCTNFFGGAKPAEFRNILLNAEASLGSLICCNQPINSHFGYKGIAQQVIPFINCTIGDCIGDYLVGGNNQQTNTMPMDRVSIAAGTANYLEMRHTVGANNFSISTGSNGNANGPLFDFQPGPVAGFFVTGAPIVNPGTLGQMSGGYYAMGGSAFGVGVWDNASTLVPHAAYSANASGQPIDMASQWRARGWGQTPMWGVRPAPWASSCILPSQVTTLTGALPAFSPVSNLRDNMVVTAGGTGYAVNDTVTLAGGTFTTAGVVRVTAVTSGAVTSVVLTNDGVYTAEPATIFTQGSTSGGGTGLQLSATGPIWFVNYNIGYPMLWGGHNYHVCNFSGGTNTHNLYSSTNTGWSYFQNLTTTNVPHLSWIMDGASPFIYLNYEMLELAFPGLVLGLVSDGTGGCTVVAQQNFMVLEVKPSLGYVKVVRVDNDGSNYLPSLAASGTVCKNNTIAQAGPNLVNPPN